MRWHPQAAALSQLVSLHKVNPEMYLITLQELEKIRELPIEVEDETSTR